MRLVIKIECNNMHGERIKMADKHVWAQSFERVFQSKVQRMKKVGENFVLKYNCSSPSLIYGHKMKKEDMDMQHTGER
jgi:hypothetical protein